MNGFKTDKRERKWASNISLLLLASALFALVLLPTTVSAVKPVFLNVTHNQIFNATQNETFFMFVLGSDADGHYPLNFSDTAASNTTNFAVFSMTNHNSTAAKINFTPLNDDVGYYSFFMIVEDSNDESELAKVYFNVTNVNDPPNITSYYPENLTGLTTKENSWLAFNVSAEDIDIQHGDYLTYTWLIDGNVNTTLLNSSNNTANYTPDFFSAGVHNITVNVNDSGGFSVFVNWTVNVTNENRAPANNDTIPNVTMIEDAGNYSLFNLSNYFFDLDLDDYPLSYNAVGNDNITMLINAAEPHNVSFVPDQDFYGVNIIQFRCFDGYNYTLSHNVTVNVTPVNDPPVVQQESNKTAYADTLFTLQIAASDPDPSDTLTYYDNTTLFDINSGSGFISDTFNVSEIGNYSILINVSDGTVNSSMIFSLSVINNSAPVLGSKPVPNMYSTEGNLTHIDFNATDVDLQDSLTFSLVSSPSNPTFTIITTNTSPEGAEAYMEFTPNQSDVGSWTITVNVTDDNGAADSDTFVINISNIENTPELLPIQNQRAKVNMSFSMTIYANDEDGDIDSFGDNTTLFNITKGGTNYNATGSISFTPNDTDVGEHLVNITVNDTTGRYDSQLVLFNVTHNQPPTIETIPNQTATEDSQFSYTVNASDPDPQDTLTYHDNSTLFNINGAGEIIFTPNENQTGIYVINITVSDGEANASTLMNLTIGSYDDYPYWTPPLDEYHVNESIYLDNTIWNSSVLLGYSTNMTVWNSSLHENNLTLIYMDAHDEEAATLSFSMSHVNFTNASNDTITTGIDLIIFTSYDGDTALANLTPNNSQVGVYYVNFTVEDNASQKNSSIIRLEVFNVNDPPIVTDYSPNLTYYQNMTENSSMMFNVTADDIDYGDSLQYQWAVNGTNISGANQTYYNYTTGFLSAGWHNITVFVLDGSNASTMLNWTVNVSNVNRIGRFGLLSQYNSTHFNAGVTKTNLTVLSGGQGVIITSGFGFKSGLFESSVLDTQETNSKHRFTTINWTGNTTPPGNVSFDVYFYTRTYNEPSPFTSCSAATISSYNYSDAYNVSSSEIISDENRCIQYKFVMTTNNSLYTPSINNVNMGYAIADRSQEQNTNQSWIDLDSYFFEPDTDDNLTFNVSGPNGTAITEVNISITPNSPYRVYSVTDSSFTGSVELVFHMFDGYNTIDSNIVMLNVTEVPQQLQPIIIPVGGGGGGVSQAVPYEVPKYVTAPVAFRLITPQIITTYVNDTMEVPLSLFNSDFTLDDIRLKASTANANVVLKLSRERISTMKPNQKEYLTLTVESYKTYGAYEIIVEATADATSIAEDGTEQKSEFQEKAKIFVNSLLKAEGNESQVNTKLAFAEDLLSTNPECLELNEFLEKARQMLADKKTNEADVMLDQVIESCKYLIAPKELKPEVEAPVRVYGMPTESLFILGAVAVITLIVAVALIIGWAHMRARKKELMRKR